MKLLLREVYRGIMKRVWPVWLFLFLAGFGTGYGLFVWQMAGDRVSGQLRKKDSEYQHISPLIACISPDKKYFTELSGFTKKIQAIADTYLSRGDVQAAGVYFRDLENGHWTGFHENDTFFPASLFKVPIMIAFLKQAETHPQVLRRQIYYSPNAPHSSDQVSGGEADPIQPARSYSVDELLRAMIVDSSNNARDILLGSIDKKSLAEVFIDLNIDFPESVQENADYGISPRKFSLLFRSLYSATLLNEAMSEKALTLLSQTKFHDGITARLPASVEVAHKFGVHASPPLGNELHDCGIIYQNDHVYFLCVMTKGNNLNQLASLIADISQAVYTEADKKK